MAPRKTTKRERAKAPKDLVQLRKLIERGKLFAVQDWIKAGWRVQDDPDEWVQVKVLFTAVTSGFHSMVEVILDATPWSQTDLAIALNRAYNQHRTDLVDLLIAHGAPIQGISLAELCDKPDIAMLSRWLHAGGDPNYQHAFAKALLTPAAPRLLHYYKLSRHLFPALDDQLALALSLAVERDQEHQIPLLLNAGADPFRPVPMELNETFPLPPGEGINAAIRAIWSGKLELFTLLALKPTPEQAQSLLSHASFKPNLEIFRQLLSFIPPDQLNRPPRNSCRALEELVSRHPCLDLYTMTPDPENNARLLKFIEQLLEAGARWNPDDTHVIYARKALVKHRSGYITQLLRLLLAKPEAIDPDQFRILCKSPTLLSKVSGTAPTLYLKLKNATKKTLP